MDRSPWCSMRPRTACTRKRASWRGASTAAVSDYLEVSAPRPRGAETRHPNIARKGLMTESAIPTRAPNETPAEDAILPFEVASLDLRGRVARLGPALDRILGSHDYPSPVAKLLGEAIVLT